MLVITRKRNEKLLIDKAVVTILKITGAVVTLGVTAPSEVAVLRQELIEKDMQHQCGRRHGDVE